MSHSDAIARVVVDVPARALTEPFDYRVPDHLLGQVTVGVPVIVPFGPRRSVGYVVALASESAFADRLRPIEAVAGTAVFDEGALELAEWIAHEYVASLADALRLFLPPGSAPSVRRQSDGTWQVVGRQLGAVTDTLVTLTPAGEAFEPRANATLQRRVLEALRVGPVTMGEMAAEYPSAGSAIRALERAGAVTCVERRRYRQPGAAPRPSSGHVLTPQQAAAVATIAKVRSTGGGVVLLDGVTGSGKTEVYLRAIEEVVAEGGSAVVLVPEISLTPQTVGRFRARLDDDVAVIHSRLSAGERFDQWQLALNGMVKVVVGARSALFAPLKDVRLVIIDEEHEPSYKQGQSPRYQARDVAERLCATRGATLVLGSATPCLESYERARVGTFHHVRLTERVGGGSPPEVQVVDMSAEFESGNRSMYSRALQERLADVAERGEKAVLFLNRRGFASFLLCRECGFVPECTRCSVSLTYHERVGALRCHHCGAQESVPVTCPRCKSPYLRRFGAGTERAQSDLAALLPDVPIVRMDADTTTGTGGHERALAAFEAQRGAVLLGTQMIAKGLDYPDVTLVGVINADTSMHVPDFRAAERTFQLLEQVSGRAGRGVLPGHVVIQTYWPDHPAVHAVASRDLAMFYERERREREPLGYPPFGRLVNIGITGTDGAAVQAAAERVTRTVKRLCPPEWEVLGPSPAPLARIKDRWRWHALVKAPVHAAVSQPMHQTLNAIGPIDGVNVVVDVDPVGML